MQSCRKKLKQMEKEKSELMELLNSPDLYNTKNPSRVLAVNTQLTTLEADLTAAYDRWDELEELAARFLRNR